MAGNVQKACGEAFRAHKSRGGGGVAVFQYICYTHHIAHTASLFYDQEGSEAPNSPLKMWKSKA